MKIRTITAILSVFIFSTASYAQENNAHQQKFEEHFNWQDVHNNILDFAYINSQHDIREYKKVFINTPEVTFQSHWLNEHGDFKTAGYRQRVAQEYSELLVKAISKHLVNDMGLQISTQRGSDVLVVLPKLLDIYIDHPDLGGVQDVLLVNPAGKAKLDLIMYSPKDEAVLAYIEDTRGTGDPKVIVPSKPRTINTRAFAKLFNEWSQDIVQVMTP